MTFSTIEFFLIFSGIMLYLILVRNNTARKLFLIIASYYIYALWDYRFLTILMGTTVLDFLVGRALGTATSPRARKALLGISVVGNLAKLAFFKYHNFFIDSLEPLLSCLGLKQGTLQIIIPLGISYYTLQSLTYTIDVYRGSLDSRTSLLDYALFVGFFPQFAAGPIVRAAKFLPQLKITQEITWHGFFEGFKQFTFGLFKKLFVADRLGLYVDHFFKNPGAFDCLSTWLGVAAYSLQLYCDFSGYSDMAIGVARIMGYRLGENFNYPYLATNISEFWRRWHISLSTWIRDYIYFSLGGNRKGQLRTYMNLLIAMSLCGLWHGASWTFVFWGAYHGMLLIARRMWLHFKGAEQGRASVMSLVPGGGWALTMILVMVGWVFFQSDSIDSAGLILHQMFWPSPGVHWVHPFALLALAGATVVHAFSISPWSEELELREKSWYAPAVLFTLLFLSIVFRPEGFKPFVYAGF